LIALNKQQGNVSELEEQHGQKLNVFLTTRRIRVTEKKGAITLFTGTPYLNKSLSMKGLSVLQRFGKPG